MSTTYVTATASTSNLILQPTIGTSSGSPIEKVLPIIFSVLSFVGSGFSLSLSLLKPLLVLSPLPIVLYLFAPLFVFINIAITLFVRLPYSTLAYLTDALYPFYVLCGVACIAGGVFGLSGRLLCRVLIRLVAGETSVMPRVESRKRDTRGRARREKVKFED